MPRARPAYGVQRSAGIPQISTSAFTAIDIFPHRIRPPKGWVRHPAQSIAPRCHHSEARVRFVTAIKGIDHG